MISFEVLLSIDFLTLHSQLLSRGFQKCMGKFLWLLSLGAFSDDLLQNWGHKILKVTKHGQTNHSPTFFPLASGRFKRGPRPGHAPEERTSFHRAAQEVR